MAQINLELGLAPYDPWVIKKNLSDYDLSYAGVLYLPAQEVRDFIIPEMNPDMVQNLGSPNGVEVKIHIVEEGHKAKDYTVTFFRASNYKYMFKGGWGNIARAKGYKTGDEIGLMWDTSSGKFLFHHIK